MCFVVLSISALGEPKALVFAANGHTSISPKSSWKHQGSFVPKSIMAHCVGHSKSQAACLSTRDVRIQYRWQRTGSREGEGV